MSLMVITATADNVMTKNGKTYVINTTTLCNKKGYKAATPLEVYIEKGKVVKIVPLPNKETKSYFAIIVKKLLPLYDNLKVSKAEDLSAQGAVDATTGATFSCKAVQASINAALKYYKAHK